MDRLAQIVLGVSSGAVTCSLGLAQPARLVADDAPASILRFSIVDEHGEAMPGRLTSTREGERGWTAARTDARGYLDLRRAFGDDSDRSIAFAQATIESDIERDVLLAVGSDDGWRVWVNGELVLRDDARQAASPFAHVIAVRLRAGANRIVVKIDNGAGEFGLYVAEL